MRRASNYGLRGGRAKHDQLGSRTIVSWLERTRSKPGDSVYWPGSWTYSDSKRGRPGDNSNTQYALLGLFAASEVGVPVKPMVWELFASLLRKEPETRWQLGLYPRHVELDCQHDVRGNFPPDHHGPAPFQGQEFLQGDTIENCGKGGINRNLQAGIDWLANHFQVGQNFGHGQQWKFYYLYGLERAGRLAGVRFFGQNDWYRLGAEELRPRTA